MKTLNREKIEVASLRNKSSNSKLHSEIRLADYFLPILLVAGPSGPHRFCHVSDIQQ